MDGYMNCFVLCPSFHGATLLSLLLNNHSQILSLGDTNPTRKYDQTCSCGKRVSDCEFWKLVKQATKLDRECPLPNLMLTYPRVSSIPVLNKSINTTLSVAGALAGRWAWTFAGHAAETHYASYKHFLEACQSWSPHDVFVDGEKSLLKFASLASLNLPIKAVIHLIRDPRGYALSCRKYGENDLLTGAAASWAIQHRRIQCITGLFRNIPVLTVRYEDLAASPRETMHQIFDFIALEAEDVVCGPKDPRKHHLIGNRMLQTFTGDVRSDETWKSQLSEEEQEMVAKAAGPLFADYGYST